MRAVGWGHATVRSRMRRALEHPLAPVLGAILFGLIYMAVEPPTADMAGHTFRTWLFERDGPAVWNAQWYGGHHVLGYSLLFAPFASLLGPALPGVVAAVAATAAFVPLAHRASVSPARATAATWLFAAGMAANVTIGRMPFALGLAFAVLAWLCADRNRRVASAALALASVWASPVAGAFLLLAAVAKAAGAGRAGLKAAAWLALPVLLGGGLMVMLFPEGGPDRFVASAFWPMFLVSLAGAALIS